MTDPTPTSPTPPQGLTEDTLREQWNAQADRFNQWESLDPDEQFAWAQKCAIAADRAARVGLVPPQGLTDAQLLELAEKELCIDDMKDAHEEHYPVEVVTDGLIAFARAAIAAHDAARAQLPPNYVDPEHTGEDRELLEAFYVASRAEGGTADEIVLRGLRAAIAADRADRPRLTREEVEARFRAWWVESFPNAPAGPHAVASHAAFAMHLLGGEVQ